MAVVAPALMAATARHGMLISDARRTHCCAGTRDATMDPRIMTMVAAERLADQHRAAARHHGAGTVRPSRDRVHVQPDDIGWLRQLVLGTRSVAT